MINYIGLKLFKGNLILLVNLILNGSNLNLFKCITKTDGNFEITIFFLTVPLILHFSQMYSSLINSSSKNLSKQS